MKIILLIMIGLSILNADFTRSGDVVTDNTTKLEWQDNEVGSSSNWEGAIQRCEDLSLGGNSDWRLPNIIELISIVDDTNFNPSINIVFQNTTFYHYWSSTTYASLPYNAWGIYFSTALQNNYNKLNYNYVRCVRAGQ